MASMLDNIRELITPSVISRTAALTGDSDSALTTGLSATIPVILATLAKRSDDSGFMTQLSRLATGAADADPLTAAKAFMSPTTTGIDTTTPMGGWLSSLFGHNVSSVTDAVARYAGLRSSSAAQLLSIGSSLVLGYLGRLMRSDRLDATGLANRLRREQADYVAAVPHGFHVPGFAREEAKPYVPEPERRPAANWAVPLLLTVIGLGALAWWANRYRPEGTVARVEDRTIGAVGTAGEKAGEMITRTLPGNIDLRVPTGGMEDRLTMYVESPSASGSNVFTFDRIAFMPGSSSLTQDSKEQIDNVAAIMRAYPSAHVTVGGHTDNSGSSAANMELSKARAESVADALTRNGVSADRVESEGFGDSRPVADNSSEDGRLQNRRVTLEVTSR